VRRVALSLPLLGWLGVLTLLGWKLGPWLPLGITVATALLVAYGWHRARVPHQVERDSAAVRPWREDRVERVGRWFGVVTSVWLAASVILLLLIVLVATLGR
jgi:hypothetical protein